MFALYNNKFILNIFFTFVLNELYLYAMFEIFHSMYFVLSSNRFCDELDNTFPLCLWKTNNSQPTVAKSDNYKHPGPPTANIVVYDNN